MQLSSIKIAEEDDLTRSGYAIVYERVKSASSDLELCYNLGKILDARRDCIVALVKLVDELLDE